MKIFIASSLYLVTFLTSIQAQERYGEGYIVHSNGDTIKGEVQRQSWVMDQNSCVFKSVDGIQKYSPQDIMAYGIFNEYHYNTLRIDDSDKMFIKKLSSGQATLYRKYVDQDVASYYVSVDGGNLVEIPFHKTRKDNLILYNTRYKGTFIALLPNCELIKGHLKNIRYSEKDFKALIDKYNTCFESKTQDVENKNRPKPQIGIKLGVGHYSIKFSSSNNYKPWLYEEDFSTKIAFSYGLTFELPIHAIKNAYFTIQADLRKLDFSNEVVLPSHSIDIHYKNEIEYLHLAIPLFFKYKFKGKNIQPFLAIGASNSFLLNYNDQTTKKTIINDVPGESSSEALIEEPKVYSLNFIMEGGVTINSAGKPRYLIGIYFQRGSQLSKILSLNNTLNSYGVNVYYLF